jgi:hypothetical protein
LKAVVISLEEYQRLSNPRPDFLTLYRDWRKNVDLESLLPEPGYFEKLRDKSPGPPPCFEE